MSMRVKWRLGMVPRTDDALILALTFVLLLDDCLRLRWTSGIFFDGWVTNK